MEIINGVDYNRNRLQSTKKLSEIMELLKLLQIYSSHCFQTLDNDAFSLLEENKH